MEKHLRSSNRGVSAKALGAAALRYNHIQTRSSLSLSFMPSVPASLLQLLLTVVCLFHTFSACGWDSAGAQKCYVN